MIKELIKVKMNKTIYIVTKLLMKYIQANSCKMILILDIANMEIMKIMKRMKKR
jgi:hypothetical protein